MSTALEETIAQLAVEQREHPITIAKARAAACPRIALCQAVMARVVEPITGEGMDGGRQAFASLAGLEWAVEQRCRYLIAARHVQLGAVPGSVRLMLQKAAMWRREAKARAVKAQAVTDGGFGFLAALNSIASQSYAAERATK